MAKTHKTFYVADLHLHHRTMPRFEARQHETTRGDGSPIPKTVEERDETIIANWNATVMRGDTVWILGDVAYAPENEFIRLMRQLNGSKHIIMGNHDKTWVRKLNDSHKGGVIEVLDYAKVSDGGRKVILSHYPIAFWDGQHNGSYHLYGHVHGTDEELLFQEFGKGLVETDKFPEFRAVNVGIMLSGYVPRTLDQIIAEHGFVRDGEFG